MFWYSGSIEAATPMMFEIVAVGAIATLVAENDSLGDRSFQPDWAIEPGSIPRFSFVDVMKGRVPAEKLQGKRILIGATAIELGDRYAVPRYGVIPGVVIQALAAESLLQDRAVQRTGSLSRSSASWQSRSCSRQGPFSVRCAMRRHPESCWWLSSQHRSLRNPHGRFL